MIANIHRFHWSAAVFFAILGTTPTLSSRILAADPIRIEAEVAYLGPDRQEKGDLFLPSATTGNGRFPAIVVIHGGGWFSGDKSSAREVGIANTLAENGYVTFNINYILAAKDRPVWPQNLYDGKTAVRWLRKNAERLNVDPERIGVLGASAGGHLAALIALTGPESGLDPAAPYGVHSCRVQAAVDLYGPVDLTTWSLPGVFELDPDLAMLPGSRIEKPELYRLASPATHADKNDPPILIIHGTEDECVPVEQSRHFAAALKKTGTPHELIVVEGARHSFDLQPSQRDLRSEVLRFLDQYLKKSNR